MKKLIWVLAIVVVLVILSAVSLGMGFFGAIVPSGGTAYAGDQVIKTFTFTNRGTEGLPIDTYDSDGDGIEDEEFYYISGID